MRKFWGSERDPVEGALRDGRPEPRDELVAALGDRVASASVPSARRWSRTAFAGALTVFMIGTFASFGGVGYAAAGAEKTATTVKQIVAPAKKERARASQSAAQNQYEHEETVEESTTESAAPVVQVKGATSSGPTPTPTPTSGTLPFTGIGLGATAALGLLLLALGVILRRREARERA